MIALKDYLKRKYKVFIQSLFRYFYGSITLASIDQIKKSLTTKQIKIEEIYYNIFSQF